MTTLELTESAASHPRSLRWTRRVQVDHLEAVHGTPIVDVKPVLNEYIDAR